MLNRTIIATTAVALLLGLRASAAEISWSEKRDLDHGLIGRDGRLAETGLLGSVPSAEQIEALLAAN